jgi:hypothetical protein
MIINYQIIFLLLTLIASPAVTTRTDDPVDKTCSFRGKKLYGKIKFVENFPDIKIKIVENFPDIKVQLVENFPDECGKWQIVENFPDIKVQIVENFPDIKVKFVNNFPGLP